MDEKPKVEVKPGESLFKLQSELGKKIKETRVKLIAQRLQEKKEQDLAQKQMESEDDEEEICGEEGEEDEPSESEQDVIESANKSNEMIDMEAMDSEQNEAENSDQSDSESLNVDDLDVTTDTTTKPRKRIISMDNDSDDERSQPNMSNGKISQNL